MHTKRRKFFFPAYVAGFFVFGFLIFMFANSARFFAFSPGIPSSFACDTRHEVRTVSGDSLTGFIAPGSNVNIFFGYYDCHDVARGDLVIYHSAAFADPLIKIVRGVPGDAFSFAQTQGGWHVLVNREVLKNSLGEPYVFNDRAHRLLALYEHDDHGIIPPDTYLIFGNLAQGSFDSSRFGLVDKSDLLGKAVPID